VFVSRWAYYSLLGIIFLVAFAVRVGITARFQGMNSPPSYSANPDQVEYEELAYHWSAGEGYSLSPGTPTACRPPGTPLVLLPVYALFGHSFLAARLWLCLLSAATCIATAWLARKGFGQVVGLGSAAWLAVYPGHFYYAMHFLSEVPAALFLVLACGFTWNSWQHGRKRDDLLAGLCWGGVVLTRPQFILVVPVGLMLVLIAGRGQRKRGLAHLALQTAALAALVVPWVVRNAVVMGKPALCTIVGGYTYWGAHNEVVLANPNLRGSWVPCGQLLDAAHPLQGSEVEREAAAWSYGLAFVRGHLGEMPGLCLAKLGRFVSPWVDTPNRIVAWAFALGWFVTAPFLFAGLVLAARVNRPALVVCTVPLLVTVLTVVGFYGSERFRDAVSPLLAIFATLAAVALLRLARGRATPDTVAPVSVWECGIPDLRPPAVGTRAEKPTSFPGT
jgi:4-amino-4-deoxy-L-arabinose transferase-like glycosyltransferase